MSQDHLHAYKGEDDSKADLEVVELIHHTCECEVERAQPQDSEDIGGVDDEWIASHSEDRRYGVHCEDEIRKLHQQQHYKERCGHQDAILPDEELLSSVVLGHGHEPLEQFHQRIALRVNLSLPLHDHLDTREDQESSEDVDDPGKLRDELCTERDHDGSHDQGSDDAPEQHLMLIDGRHREVGEEQGKDKHVVHAE